MYNTFIKLKNDITYWSGCMVLVDHKIVSPNDLQGRYLI